MDSKVNNLLNYTDISSEENEDYYMGQLGICKGGEKMKTTERRWKNRMKRKEDQDVKGQQDKEEED